MSCRAFGFLAQKNVTAVRVKMNLHAATLLCAFFGLSTCVAAHLASLPRKASPAIKSQKTNGLWNRLVAHPTVHLAVGFGAHRPRKRSACFREIEAKVAAETDADTDSVRIRRLPTDELRAGEAS